MNEVTSELAERPEVDEVRPGEELDWPALDWVGRWRPWDKGYCAYYPRIGGGPALGRLVAGPVEPDGHRCYEVRATAGYYALFRPDGTYVGALVPLD